MRAALRTGLAAALATTVAFGGIVPAQAAEPAGVVNEDQAISAELIDSDGDGIPDAWENNGVVLEDGTVLDLPAYGADANRPDIFLQLNWMESEFKSLGCEDAKAEDVDLAQACANANTKEYGLDAEHLQQIVDLFDDHGINLHIDAGATFNNLEGYEARGGETLEYTKNYFENETPALKMLNDIDSLLGERQNIFRVGVIGDQMDAHNLSTGASLVNDSAFFVANHRYMDEQELVRNTVLHELGHTLGLRHQGANKAVKDVQGMKLDTSDYKSVMNYSYQFDIFNYSEQPYELKTPAGVIEVPADWDALVLNGWRIGAKGVAMAPSLEGEKPAKPAKPAKQQQPAAEKVEEKPAPQEAPQAEAKEQKQEQKQQPAPQVQQDVNVAAIVAPVVAVLAAVGIGFAVMSMQGLAIPGLAL